MLSCNSLKKKKKIDSYKEHIDDDLRIDIGDKTLKKSKTKHLMRKFNYLLNLRNITMSIKRSYRKHINRIDINDNDNHIEHENEQSNHINLPTINASDFLMYYANETENKTILIIIKEEETREK